MKNVINKIAVLFLLLHLGCKDKKNTPAVIKKENNTEEKYITNITDISKDTVIACNYISGLMYSANSGKTWKHFKTSLMFKGITYTDKKILVGIDSWHGIHESSYAKIHVSKDFGNSWETITFDTDKFFPSKIISDPKEPLCILTDENKIYKFQGTDYKKDWVYVKTISEPEMTRDIIDYPYGVHEANFKLKLYKMKQNKTDTLVHLNLCYEVREVILKDNIVHVSGSGLDEKTNKEYGYYAQFINDKILKQYRLPGWFAEIKKTKFNVYIMCENGLYKEENGKIQHLY